MGRSRLGLRLPDMVVPPDRLGQQGNMGYDPQLLRVAPASMSGAEQLHPRPAHRNDPAEAPRFFPVAGPSRVGTGLSAQGLAQRADPAAQMYRQTQHQHR